MNVPDVKSARNKLLVPDLFDKINIKTIIRILQITFFKRPTCSTLKINILNI